MINISGCSQDCLDTGWEKVINMKPEKINSSSTLYVGLNSQGLVNTCFDRCWYYYSTSAPKKKSNIANLNRSFSNSSKILKVCSFKTLSKDIFQKSDHKNNPKHPKNPSKKRKK